jgi:hypothetical protein
VRILAPVLVAAAVPVFGLMAIHHRQHAREQRLAEVASQIAGRPVDVHCPGILQRLVDVSSHAGSVYFDADGRPANITELNDETCSTLADFAEGDTNEGDSLRVARALHVLAHESFHLAGVRDEAEADCLGLQRTAFVADRLGATADEARRLAVLALAERALSAPADYPSPACHDNGALDLDPASPVWP